MHRIRRISQYVVNVKSFDDNTNDEHTRRNQILSTRLYTILLIAILLAFTLYMSLLHQTIINTISTPTHDQYERLHQKFSNTLQCPCEDIAILYEKFLHIKLNYHQICSLDLVSQVWIDYLFNENISYYFQLDFRHSDFAQFQALRTLCEQAQQTIEDSLIQFHSMQFLTPQLVSFETFDIQSNAFTDLFIRTTPSMFQNVVKLFRQTSINNRLLSELESNYVLEFFPYEGWIYIYICMNNIYYYET